MSKVIMPLDVTPKQLDTMFRRLLKMLPREERAVRLRLEGQTYDQITVVLNDERQAGEKQVPQMWAFRRCRMARVKMATALSWAGSPDYEGPTTSIYGTASKIAKALDRGSQSSSRKMLPPKPEGRREKLYLCHKCYEPTLEARPNTGGKRNTRIHVCLKCGREHTTVERNSKWSYVPVVFARQPLWVPSPDKIET